VVERVSVFLLGLEVDNEALGTAGGAHRGALNAIQVGCELVCRGVGRDAQCTTANDTSAAYERWNSAPDAMIVGTEPNEAAIGGRAQSPGRLNGRADLEDANTEADQDQYP
jgi:hypothetical protein